jgi:hypothetical protein
MYVHQAQARNKIESENKVYISHGRAVSWEREGGMRRGKRERERRGERERGRGGGGGGACGMYFESDSVYADSSEFVIVTMHTDVGKYAFMWVIEDAKQPTFNGCIVTVVDESGGTSFKLWYEMMYIAGDVVTLETSGTHQDISIENRALVCAIEHRIGGGEEEEEEEEEASAYDELSKLSID